jgi:two-component system sensor histidine kinase VanS
MQVVLIATAAAVLGLIIRQALIDGLFQTAFAESFIRFCQRTLHLSYSESQSIYGQLFRSNKGGWLAGGLFLLMLLIFYFALARMTRYFNEVSAGMDQLLVESDREITLSPEMDFMAAKLNKIKSILVSGSATPGKRSSGKTIWWSIWRMT